jgi:hypothetical protein
MAGVSVGHKNFETGPIPSSFSRNFIVNFAFVCLPVRLLTLNLTLRKYYEETNQISFIEAQFYSQTRIF